MKADLLRFIVFNSTEVPNEELNVFREALVRNKRTQNLYFESENAVAFNGKLFRSSIRFPANAPEGNYKVATYLLREGKVIDSKETELFISKAGLEKMDQDLQKILDAERSAEHYRKQAQSRWFSRGANADRNRADSWQYTARCSRIIIYYIQSD